MALYYPQQGSADWRGRTVRWHRPHPPPGFPAASPSPLLLPVGSFSACMSAWGLQHPQKWRLEQHCSATRSVGLPISHADIGAPDLFLFRTSSCQGAHACQKKCNLAIPSESAAWDQCVRSTLQLRGVVCPGKMLALMHSPVVNLSPDTVLWYHLCRTRHSPQHAKMQATG